jgi:hypothetical protein
MYDEYITDEYITDEHITEEYAADELVVGKYVIDRCMENKIAQYTLQYDDWDLNTVKHVLLGFIRREDFDGTVNILGGFVRWYKNNKDDGYIPVCGGDNMYSYTCLENILNYVTTDKGHTIIKKFIAAEISADRAHNSLKNMSNDTTFIFRTVLVYCIIMIGLVIVGPLLVLI